MRHALDMKQGPWKTIGRTRCDWQLHHGTVGGVRMIDPIEGLTPRTLGGEHHGVETRYQTGSAPNSPNRTSRAG